MDKWKKTGGNADVCPTLAPRVRGMRFSRPVVSRERPRPLPGRPVGSTGVQATSAPQWHRGWQPQYIRCSPVESKSCPWRFWRGVIRVPSDGHSYKKSWVKNCGKCDLTWSVKSLSTNRKQPGSYDIVFDNDLDLGTSIDEAHYVDGRLA